jgi:hypothetical protein
MSDKTRVLHMELECCYGCPYAIQERFGDKFIFYCVEAWDKDETMKRETHFELRESEMTKEPPSWCPLPLLHEGVPPKSIGIIEGGSSKFEIVSMKKDGMK